MTDSSRNTILVVDDEEGILEVSGDYFERKGYIVYTARNGQEALEIVGNVAIGCCFTDINMPVMDGLTLVKSVRTINKEIPIMMITTEGEKTSILEALKAGVNNYIVKPFTPQTLKEKLEQVLGK